MVKFLYFSTAPHGPDDNDSYLDGIRLAYAHNDMASKGL